MVVSQVKTHSAKLKDESKILQRLVYENWTEALKILPITIQQKNTFYDWAVRDVQLKAATSDSQLKNTAMEGRLYPHK